MNANLQPAYVLHYRDYRETSFLVDLLTKNSGRISVIARGAKRPRSTMRGMIQPFSSIVVTWRGKGELPTLYTAEANSAPIILQQQKLLSGFYLNELLMRILHRHSPCENIFTLYENTIREVSTTNSVEAVLRKFEKYFLRELGYELQLTHITHTNLSIEPGKNYLFIPNEGFSLVTSSQSGQNIFRGESLLHIAADNYASKEVLRDAKRLMRLALQPLLKDKGLKSRELFV